jgi:hypothetical protein
MYNGNVNILTGVDGFANGTMTANPTFFQSDLYEFGSLPGVTV